MQFLLHCSAFVFIFLHQHYCVELIMISILNHHVDINEKQGGFGWTKEKAVMLETYEGQLHSLWSSPTSLLFSLIC